MYDASFDDTPGAGPALDRRLLWALRIAGLIGVFAAASADAQLPGAPVLQNVWATPGFVGAVNLAGGSGGSVYAAAFGWTPGSGRFQVSGGLGARTGGGTGSRAAYGARVAMPFGGASSSFGFAAFAGVGGNAGGTTTTSTTTTTATVDSTAWTTQIPVGAAIGWRRPIGATHGLSVYATPAYVFYSGGTATGGLFRAAIGADVGITSAIGATVGVDFGGTRSAASGGPSSTQYGVGVSYAFGHR